MTGARTLADGLTFDGREFAGAWLNVSLAADEDDSRPILYRSVAVDVYAEGLRLTSTDGTILLTCRVDGDTTFDEAPIETVVVSDPDRRGRALLTYLLAQAIHADKNDLDLPEVSLRIHQPIPEARPALSPELERRHFTIATGTETVDLEVIEGEYPQWRSLYRSHASNPTDSIIFSAELLARFGKLKDILGIVRFEFDGALGSAHVQIGEGDLEGLIMPTRWIGA